MANGHEKFPGLSRNGPQIFNRPADKIQVKDERYVAHPPAKQNLSTR